MSSYVLVSADFPGITSSQRDKIYACLEKEKWKKVTEPGRDISTTWYASFNNDVSESSAIKITKDDFDTCCNGYCEPKLVIHWGQSKPTFHNLD